MRNLTHLQKLARDITTNSCIGYANSGEAENKIRDKVEEIMGGTKFDFYAYNQHKWELFEIMREVLDVEVSTLLEKQFDSFVEIRNVELGDTVEFYIEDTSLFRVATIASGLTDIRRQRLDGGKLNVGVEKVAIKIYAEWDRFMSGRIDFPKMIERVAKSMSVEIGTKIYNAIYGAFDTLATDLKASGTLELGKLRSLIESVELGTGKVAEIYGTKSALGLVSEKIVGNGNMASESMKDRMNKFGYFGEFEGTAMFMIPQATTSPSSRTPAIDKKFLLIVPANEKIIKMIIEGDATIYDKQRDKDQQIEYFMSKMIGIGVITSRIFAIYRFA